MRGEEARTLLGFPPNSRPTLPQVKAAYRRKVWESHPDLFPAQEKPHAEYKFKLISEAYSCLLSGDTFKDSEKRPSGYSGAMGQIAVAKEVQRIKQENTLYWLLIVFILWLTTRELISMQLSCFLGISWYQCRV
ncbi:uncharacterized protein LOC122318565 isoform X3 [Carya illinoinensis]|uniref:uncharacterized protein LOC122318565 isoform X3 n=1 Tax=Carya illinoinensis TaxID=32201 RepID=UPI001C71B238|nr:uncharacterized protein LOC122318565 isoform X3 [Carya illinoinensis]